MGGNMGCARGKYLVDISRSRLYDPNVPNSGTQPQEHTMPRTKSLGHYPRQYFDLVESAAVENEPILIEMDSRVHALKLRGHFYAFVGALRVQAALLEAARTRRQLTPEENRVLDASALSAQVLVQVSDLPNGQGLVTFTNREHSWQAKAVRRWRRGPAPAESDVPPPSAALLALLTQDPAGVEESPK